MGCPPVRGDNSRALASGLSYEQMDKHGITTLYHLHRVDLAHHEIFRDKGDKVVKCLLLFSSIKERCIITTEG